MAAPSAALIETDPPLLNSGDFPFAVTDFPAQLLAQAAQVIPVNAFGAEPPPQDNPHRYEP